MIDVRGVSLSLGGFRVLESIDVRLEQGQYLGLIGPNGGGKTVLLKLLLGLYEPDCGEVRVLGLPPRRARGRVAYVPQFPTFDTSFPIRAVDVVEMGAWGRRRPVQRGEALARLEQVGLADRAERQIGDLSGGQRQRVMLARALISEAPLVLLDEPMANLDPGVEKLTYELLEELSQQRTLVLVSHDIGVMVRYVDQVACVNRRCWQSPVDRLSAELFEQAFGPIATLMPFVADQVDGKSAEAVSGADPSATGRLARAQRRGGLGGCGDGADG